MGWWFQKPKPPPMPNQPPQPASASPANPSIRQLELRLQELEEHIASLAAKRPEIRIDTLHIHQPVLENLTFRLDQLEIKELSGSLNLGNNFGAKPNSPSPKGEETLKKAGEFKGKAPSPAHFDKTAANSTADMHRERPPDRSPLDAPLANTERTSTGYRITPQSKPTGGV
ncbi:hypothetical protein [Paenibacillus sp. SI8]|uniref:hypothetical protein n=1 Tax=unclassified Paenibacillus TaxID=185978 RepID=UPI003467080C